jgi:hypothetical protein
MAVRQISAHGIQLKGRAKLNLQSIILVASEFQNAPFDSLQIWLSTFLAAMQRLQGPVVFNYRIFSVPTEAPRLRRNEADVSKLAFPLVYRQLYLTFASLWEDASSHIVPAASSHTITHILQLVPFFPPFVSS